MAPLANAAKTESATAIRTTFPATLDASYAKLGRPEPQARSRRPPNTPCLVEATYFKYSSILVKYFGDTISIA
jgi:hypothetical protein